MKNPVFKGSFIQVWISVLIALTLVACSDEAARQETAQTWEQVLEKGSHTRVDLMMWQGDPYINSYMQEYVRPRVKELYDIDLEIASGQGNRIVSLLMGEIEAGKQTSSIDMMWINGETFYQLRQINGLYGPFTDLLPNASLIDWSNPTIATDFQQPVEGYESPWGNVQLAIIYDSLLTPVPPATMEELAAYLKQNPGTFTIPNEFTGMTLLKSWLIALAGGNEELAGPFSEEKYEKYSSMLWDYINSIKPYMWKKGSTFPDGPATLHRLLLNGEVHFSMSNNDGEVDNKVLQGLLPQTARAFVFDSGTIRNSHYMGVASRSDNKEGAMIVANFLLSPEAQFTKMQPSVWGDGTVLDTEQLPEEWQEQFSRIPGRVYAPDRREIADKALMELAPEYMIRLYDDFRTKIIEGK